MFSANQLETDIARSHAKAQYLMQYPYVNFQLILSEVCLLLSGGDQMEASSWETSSSWEEYFREESTRRKILPDGVFPGGLLSDEDDEL